MFLLCISFKFNYILMAPFEWKKTYCTLHIKFTNGFQFLQISFFWPKIWHALFALPRFVSKCLVTYPNIYINIKHDIWKSQILVDLGLIKIWKKYLLHGGKKKWNHVVSTCGQNIVGFLNFPTGSLCNL
jgi:hypothetical protein